MNIQLQVPLHTNAEQSARLLQLQAAFAQVCNALVPQVKATRCWNRVALHHMAYKSLREQFPAMGSQMVCNAIYSVSRACRLLFQHVDSPFNLAKLGGRDLPSLEFSDSCPVYFDRHTLSLKRGQLSMYTLDGRMRFQLDLKPEDEANFQQKKLREVVLSRRADEIFELAFWFTDEAVESDIKILPADLVPGHATEQLQIPEYLVVQEAA